MSFIDTLLMPFQFDFMRNALIISVLIAIPTALLSCFLILKGWSLMGDAMSHAVFPGIVIAYIVGLPYAVGAFTAGMLCALATGFLKENSRIKQDTVMGVVFSGMFGLGLVLFTSIESDVHLAHILFGDMLGIGWQDILETSLIVLIATGFIVIKWRELMLFCFDPVQARVSGLPVRLLHYGLLVVLSLTIVGVLKAVGIILAISMLITPGATAFLLTRTLGTMLPVSLLVAVGSAFSGVYLSFFIDSAPAPTIVMLMTLVFIAAFLISTRRTRRMEMQGKSA